MSMMVIDDEDTSAASKASSNQLADAIVRLHRRGANFNLTQMFSKLKPAELAGVLNGFPEHKATELFSLISVPQHAAQVLEEIGRDHRIYILSHCEIEQAASILHCLSPEVCRQRLEELDEDVIKRIRNVWRQEDGDEASDPTIYKKDTAGSIMGTNVFTLPESTLSTDAIQAVQGLASHNSVFYLYVVDDHRRLTGVCSLRKLILANPNKTLKEFTQSRIVSVHVDTPQNEVANQISRYRLLAMPVVDDEGILVGQITIDSLIHVIQEENTVSLMKMAGIGSKKTDVLSQTPFEIFKARVPWLISAFVAYLMISAILDGFKATLEAVVQLAFFFPIVIGMSGNAGSQTGTVVVRGLALGTIHGSHFFKLLFKELGANLIQGLLYGTALAIAAYAIFQNTLLSLTVGPALVLNITASAAIAMSLPFFFKRIGADPAVAAGPLALAFIDMVGSINYLVLAFFIFKL